MPTGGVRARTSGIMIPAFVAPAGGCAAATAFLARTSGLDAGHTDAYTNLVCGLVTDGLFNSNGGSDYFDWLHVYATMGEANALLNLVSSPAYNGTNANSLTFTQDQGFTGDSTGGHYIDSNFNATTAPSPKYARDSAHISFWCLSSAASGQSCMTLVGNPTNGTNIILREPGDNLYVRVNDGSGSGSIATNADATGHYFGNRSGANAREAYKNGASVGTYGAVASGPLDNANMIMLESSPYQAAAASAGASLSAAQVTLFYNRLRTYMTAVGVP